MARLSIIGQSGTGKSWAGGALQERILDPEHPDHPGKTFDLAVHFDPENEEVGLSDVENRPLYKRLDVDVDTAKRLDWKRVLLKHRRVRVVPDMTVENGQELLGTLSGALFDLCQGEHGRSALLSSDEVGTYATQTGIDKRVLIAQTRGRKHGLETMHSMQRPQQAHTELISETDRRFYFRINDDNALTKLQSQAGFNVERLPEAAGEFAGTSLSELPDRHVVIENVSSGDLTVECTENWTRLRPHYSDDDGVIDDALPV